MTPEQRTRAARHYAAEAAVALRIEQLEAQNAMLLDVMRDIETIEKRADGLRGSGMVDFSDIKAIRAMAAKARAALANVEAARTGANT